MKWAWRIVIACWCVIIPLDIWAGTHEHTTVTIGDKPCAKIASNEWECRP